jgi:prepilin-type N-terminal cleavage/methylation domain-containing protein
MRLRLPENKIKRKSGYTMLEILTVVGILTILITMAIPSMTRMRRHGYESAAIDGLRAIADAEELYYDVSGYYTAGGNQIDDLRKVDAIDSGQYGASAGAGIFIKGYSIIFTDIGEHPQNYSCRAVPILRGLDLRTFFLEADGIVRDQSDKPV